MFKFLLAGLPCKPASIQIGVFMQNDEQSPELKRANLRMALCLGSVAILSLVVAAIGVSRMLSAGTF